MGGELGGVWESGKGGGGGEEGRTEPVSGSAGSSTDSGSGKGMWWGAASGDAGDLTCAGSGSDATGALSDAGFCEQHISHTR